MYRMNHMPMRLDSAKSVIHRRVTLGCRPSSPKNGTRNTAVAAHAVTDRKSTRLNSSHVSTSYAVFCLKKKIQRNTATNSSKSSECECSNCDCRSLAGGKIAHYTYTKSPASRNVINGGRRSCEIYETKR